MMIPKNSLNNIETIELKKYSDRTFRINEDSTVYGFISTKKALKQWIVTALSTERYKYEIYSWNFGLETDDLCGRHPSYVISELKARIVDTLCIDDRIAGVSDFAFHILDKKIIRASFLVKTVYDDEYYEKDFEILC